MRQFEEILKLVSDVQGVSIKDMKTQTRKREIKEARQIAMYLAFKHTNQSSSWIGEQFNQDHATALHAAKYIQKLYDTDPHLKSAVDRCEKMLSIDDKMKAVEASIERMSEQLIADMKNIVATYNDKISLILRKQ